MANKKALVVYYSRSGTTKVVAEAVAGMLRCDIEEVVDRKDRSGARGYLVSLKDALCGSLADIGPAGKEAATYDLVVIGTPVWAWSMSPAIRAYLSAHRDHLRQVAFFCTTGGTGIQRTFRHMEELCAKKPVAILGLTMSQVLKGDLSDQVKAFVEAIR